MTKPVLLLNGPNLNMLGLRQPEIYGHATLDDVADACGKLASDIGLTLDARQSNWEGQLVDWIQECRQSHAGLIFNPGAYSHTSIAIMDALSTFEGPIVEVHVSNIHAREEFRHFSFVSQKANAVIAGAGVHGYELGLMHLAKLIEG